MAVTNTRVAGRSDDASALSRDQHQSTAGLDVVDLLREGRSKSRTPGDATTTSLVPGDPYGKEVKRTPLRVAQLDDHPIPPLPIPDQAKDLPAGNGGRRHPLDLHPRSAPDVERNIPIPPRRPFDLGPSEPVDRDSVPRGAGERIPLPPRRPDREHHAGEGPLPRPAGASSFDFLNPEQPMRAHTRTIAILDVFKRTPIVADPKNPGTYDTHGSLMLDGPKNFIPHGELIAQNAEQNGYNVLRLQDNTVNKGTGFDFSKPLAGIYQGVLSGKLNLIGGDIVNMSLAQNNPGLMGEPSFDEANQFLKLAHPITPENLDTPQERAEILAAMRAKIQDNSVDPKLRERLRQAVDTNTMISKLQNDLGIEVVVAAGNKGPTRFNWDFLSASQRLSATDQDGTTRMYWSALESSPGAKAQGSFDVRYTSDLFDPHPNPSGKYFVAGTKLSLSASQFGGPRLEPPDPNNLKGMLGPPDLAASKGFAGVMSPYSPTFMPSPAGTPHIVISRSRSAPEVTERFIREQQNGEHITQLDGTSFSNFNWYAANRPAQR